MCVVFIGIYKIVAYRIHNKIKKTENFIIISKSAIKILFIVLNINSSKTQGGFLDAF